MFQKIIIPENLFEQCLTNELCCGDFQQKNKNLQNELSLLYRLSKAQPINNNRGEEYPFIGNFKLSDDEVEILKKYTTSENRQIRAYSNDVCSYHVSGKDIINMIRSASEDYLWLYERCQTPWYLLRAITVRRYKGLNDIEFLEKIRSAFQKKIHSGWITEYCKALSNMKYSKEDLLPIYNILNEEINKIEMLSDKSDKFGELHLVDALFELGFINKNELHYKKAMICETEYDYRKSEKLDNILAYNLQSIEDSFHEIKLVKGMYMEDYLRIKEKYYIEQKLFLEQFYRLGTKIEYEIPKELIDDTKKYVESLKLKNPKEILESIISFPFPEEKQINEQLGMSMMRRKSLGSIGQTIGTSSPDDAKRINFYWILRLNMRFIINQFLKKASELYNENNEKEFIEYLKNNCSTQYINEEQKLLWVLGFVQAFSGQYVLASHVLVPQIENYLRNKVESIYGPMHKLENKRQQNEPTLTDILETLKIHFKEDLYNDFRFFFNTPADVNMRNNMAHGLWNYTEILKHSPYCIWIALKIYFCEDEIFVD